MYSPTFSGVTPDPIARVPSSPIASRMQRIFWSSAATPVAAPLVVTTSISGAARAAARAQLERATGFCFLKHTPPK